MIQFEDLWNHLKAFLELLDLSKNQPAALLVSRSWNLFEMITQFDNRRGLEHPILIDDKLSML